MKSFVLTETHKPLEIEERPGLEPAPGEVVVQLKAAALNRRDFWITQGMYPGIELPIVLGSDGAGVVSKIGAGVDSSWLSKDVIINPGFDWGSSESAQADEFTILGLPRNGTFATEVSAPVSQLHQKPSGLDWKSAAAVPLAGVTAYRAVFSQGKLAAGETVLISGVGGGVATFALQFAVAAGAEVWVTSSSAEKIERAVGLGAKGGFNYREDGWENTCPPADLIIDSAAGSGYANLVALAAQGGRIVNYGSTTGPPEKLDMFKVFWKQLSLIGSTMGSPTNFAGMLSFVEKHKIEPVIDATFPLEDCNRALQQMESSPQFGKYVLQIA
ncbi:MAG: zinc-binding alcohol dehydrogenase/oxidoreductase [Verrucomicrobiales bacterium]|jgi:zinc-binding alcohol dehydrogenase/oxidoreductase